VNRLEELRITRSEDLAFAGIPQTVDVHGVTQ
jgi:hypothetical protein